MIFFCIFINNGLSQAIKVDSDGKVGFGTSSPVSKIEVENGEFLLFDAQANKSGILFAETDDKYRTSVKYGAFIEFDEGDNNNEDELRLGGYSNDNKSVGIQIWRGTGHVGIGGSNDSWTYELRVDDDLQVVDKLDVGGSVWVDGNQVHTSDINVKTAIENISGNDILNKIQQIDGKRYKYKNKEDVAEIIYNNKGITKKPANQNAIENRQQEEFDSSLVSAPADSSITRTETIDIPNLPKGEHYGLIAQEVMEAFPEVVSMDSSTMLYGINYNAFIPILLEAIKAEQSLINEQRVEINKSKEEISKQNSDITELQQILLNQQQSITRLQEENALIKAQCCAGLLEEPQSGQELKSATGPVSQSNAPKTKEVEPMPGLEQNNPNPFTEATEIKYYLPEETRQAILYIYDLQGKPVKNYKITQMGNASHIIKGSELSAGLYLYTLIADGKEVGTKRMILTN